MMQHWIIGFLHEREEQGLDTFQKDIEKEFSINRSTTSEMLTLMCKKGMIQRIPVSYDGRLKKIILTSQSREFHENLEIQFKKVHNILVQTLTDEEVNEFIRISDKLISNIKEHLDQG